MDQGVLFCFKQVDIYYLVFAPDYRRYKILRTVHGHELVLLFIGKTRLQVQQLLLDFLLLPL
jgi:hypothetical protein